MTWKRFLTGKKFLKTEKYYKYNNKKVYIF